MTGDLKVGFLYKCLVKFKLIIHWMKIFIRGSSTLRCRSQLKPSACDRVPGRWDGFTGTGCAPRHRPCQLAVFCISVLDAWMDPWVGKRTGVQEGRWHSEVTLSSLFPALCLATVALFAIGGPVMECCVEWAIQGDLVKGSEREYVIMCAL